MRLAPPARWLYHLVAGAETVPDPYTPASLALEGFIHCSYQPAVAESARLYFPPDAPLRALQIDPRLVGVAIEEGATPRGPMPHIFGPLRRAAIVRTLSLAELDAAPDAITSPSDRR